MTEKPQFMKVKPLGQGKIFMYALRAGAKHASNLLEASDATGRMVKWWKDNTCAKDVCLSVVLQKIVFIFHLRFYPFKEMFYSFNRHDFCPSKALNHFPNCFRSGMVLVWDV